MLHNPGPGPRMRWDQVIDLGISGAHTYELWGEFFQCPVADLGFQRTASGPVRNALGAGLGFLLDDHGIDWWEVISMQYVQQIYRIVALQELVSNISSQDEVFVSRLVWIRVFWKASWDGQSHAFPKARSFREKFDIYMT